MNHATGCAYFEKYNDAACDCLAGRYVRATEVAASQLALIAKYLDFLTDHLGEIGRGV